MAYSAEQKAAAVEVIRRYGGLTAEAITVARELLGAPTLSISTLHGWLKAPVKPVKTPAAPRIETEAKKESETEARIQAVKVSVNDALDKLFEATARNYLMRANDPQAIADTKGKDAVIAAATALDKLRLLQGLPTEIIAVIPGLVETIRRKGYDPTEAMKTMLTQFASLPDAPMVTDIHGAN
jgi:hypothetical protein